MLRSCACVGNSDKRRNSPIEESSEGHSSEIDNFSQQSAQTTNKVPGVLRLFNSKGWCRHFRKPFFDEEGPKAEQSIRAAILIQKWYRRNKARMEMQRRCNWQIFQNLEYASEQDQAELYKFYNDLLEYMPAAAGAKNDQSLPRSTICEQLPEHHVFMSEAGEFATIKIEFPMKKIHVESLIDIFRKKRSKRLDPAIVSLILRNAVKNLKLLPNLWSVSTSVSQQMTICGDLHGKLDDLLVILYKNGLPSTSNPYIFNGDFVDRGKKGLEVFLLLLSLFMAFPNAVFLNRGNHEDSVMNARYGFLKEIQTKYPNNHKALLILIDEVYRWLPLGSIINNRIFVIHGGISDNTNLTLLKTLDRSRIFNIMWSDPQLTPGCSPNTLRGAGVYWGPDVTQTFLKDNSLIYVIRSHECKACGHEFTHEDKVITIFSASNYYAMGSNKGAYMKLNHLLQPYFVQYISGASQARRLSFKQHTSMTEMSALKELAVRIRENRNELENEFRIYDPDNKGHITVTQWCDSIQKVTKLNLPWRHLRKKLAPGSDNQYVYFNATLELLDSDIIIEAEADGVSLMDSLYENKSNLEAIFNIIDSDNSGEITIDEFEKSIDLLNVRLQGKYSKDEMMEKCRMMDLNNDGKVDLNEFLEAFRMSKKDERASKLSNPNRVTSEAVLKVYEQMQRKPVVYDDDIDPSDCESNIYTAK